MHLPTGHESPRSLGLLRYAQWQEASDMLDEC